MKIFKIPIPRIVIILLFVFGVLHPAQAADGSGTNIVSPTSVTTGSTGNTLTFTFTAAETMDNGGITINVPSGWSTPQGTAGTAGFTAVSSTGVVANIEDNADSATGWSAGTACTNGLSADTVTKQEGTAAIKCANGNEANNDSWYKNITAENWSGFTKIAFWLRSDTAITAGRLNFAYDDSANLASPIEQISVGGLSANTWTYVVLTFGATTRTSVTSFGFVIKHPAALDNVNVWVDDILIGPGSPSFPGGGDISVRFLQLANTQTVTTTYGSGGGASGATAPSTAGTSTFTTKSRISDAGTLTNIATSPTVTVGNPVPTTTSISPTSKTVGDAQFTMTVNGTNFVSGASVVRFDGSNRTTTFVSSTQLTATIPASDMTSAGTHDITVFNPTPGGGTSNAQTFTVNNVVPTTTSISPSSKTVGDPGFTMTVNGTNFISSSVVRFDGSNRTTTFVSSTQLTATIPSSDLITAGTFSITVFNPSPGGGTSNAQTFTVNNPVPTTTSISPSSKTVGDAQFTMTVNGTNFISSSVVRFNGSNRTTTFVSATQVTATIPSTDLTAAGTFPITVFNPTPGGGESNSQTFTVNAAPSNPVPTTTSISPSSKTVGDAGFTMTVNGTNFISSSVVRFNGSDRTTTFVSSTQVTATIPSTDLTTAGTFPITVFNPTPGGGVSNSQTFTVNAAPSNPVPTTSSISPVSKTVGDAGFTLTVNGTNFISSSVVRFNGSNRTTTFVSSTQVTADIPNTDLTTAGNFPITVFNPTPGGGESNSQTFTVNAASNPVPTTTSISPASKTVGDSGFTLTVDGTNFISSSVVRFNGLDRTTTFVSSTQVTASIPSTDLTTAGTFPITVFNPTPGGGESNSQTFTVNAAGGAPPPPTPAPVFIPPPSIGGVAPTNIVFSGRAYPAGKVRFFRRSSTDIQYRNTFVLDTETTADSNGKFEKQFAALLQGEYFFAVEAKDKDGRSSGILGFTANLIATNELKAESIFVPPTVDFETAVVTKGKDLKVVGYASPGSAILLEIDRILTYGTQANDQGFYTVSINTRRFSAKDHFMKGQQIDKSGVKSEFSPIKTFTVSFLSYPQADFNNDGIINITDWSIFLFRYRSKDASLRSKVDLDMNGKVDITDFSIFLKAIRGL